jgi:hypothetical protein
MPSFGLVGPTYALSSPNLDAQKSINLYCEVIESGAGKSKIALRGTPGLHTWTTLPTAPVRGLWAGEGRLFAVGGALLYEVMPDGSTVSKGDVGDDAQHTPVQIWPNGNQLLIVSAGKAWIHTGAELIQPKFVTGSGRVNTSGSNVERLYGDEFGAWMEGAQIVINGTGYTVLDVVDRFHLTLTGIAGTQTDVAYTVASGGDADANGTSLTWHAGDEFAPSMIGHPINVAGVSYTVASVEDPKHLTLATAVPGVGPVKWWALPPVAARTGTYLDGYFIVAPPDSKQFFFSALNDGKVWDPLEYSTKEGYPDNIAAIYSDHEELWLFGTHHSIEVWRNEGDKDAAGGFRRDPGAFIHCALVAPWSVCSLASGLHFLGGDVNGRTVAYRAQGFQPVRVSNHAVEQAWAAYDVVWDAYGYTYIDEGHPFWVINFQTANATWVYDVSTQMWHERGSWNGSAFEKHRGRCYTFAFDRNLVGDWQNGKIYEMSTAFYDDDGVAIRRRRTAPHISVEEARTFHHRLQLDLEVTTPSKPAVTLDWSDDDGATWRAGITRAPSTITKKGRLVWNRLGSARDRIYGITITDQAQVAIADAYLQVSPGAH